MLYTSMLYFKITVKIDKLSSFISIIQSPWMPLKKVNRSSDTKLGIFQYQGSWLVCSFLLQNLVRLLHFICTHELPLYHKYSILIFCNSFITNATQKFWFSCYIIIRDCFFVSRLLKLLVMEIYVLNAFFKWEV